MLKEFTMKNRCVSGVTEEHKDAKHVGLFWESLVYVWHMVGEL